MTDAQDEAKKKLTLWEALKDLGWLPLVLMSVGGLSIIDILETAVFGDLNLITPFQIVLDGYHRITTLTGAIVEPLIQPAVDRLNARWNWQLHLLPVWRPMFILGMAYVVSSARASLKMGGWASSVSSFILLGLGVLAGSIASGLVPTDSGWWAQGLMAAAPITMLMFGLAMANAIGWSVRQYLDRNNASGTPEQAWHDFFLLSGQAVRFGAYAFGLATALTLVPGIGGSAGILAFAGSISVIAVVILVAGLRRSDRGHSRAGLSILGGFAMAGVILLSNWVVVALAQPTTRPERTIPGMTTEQARDQIVQWCAARGASIDQATIDEVMCSGLPVILASAPATPGSPRRYQVQAMIDTQDGGVRVTAWPYTTQPSESDMPADQRREVQAMLDDLHPGPSTPGPAAQPVAPPAAPPRQR